MQVLFVTNRYPTDETPGSSPCIELQRRAIQQLGHHVDVLFINGEQSKLNYVTAVWHPFRTSPVGRRPELVHAHYGYSGLVACIRFRCPIVVTFRGSDVLSRRERPISRLVAKLADEVIVMTGEMKEVLGRHDAHVIPYGIDLDLFKPYPPAEARRALSLPMEAPLVLFPYNPGRTLKRFDLVQQAIAILRKEFPDIQVLAIHDEPHASVATYMNACDAMVLTSEREGSPVAIREAMACNLPIVSVDVGDVADLIRGVEGCYLVKPDPADIAEKVALVLRTRQRTNGRPAAQRLSVSRSAADVVAIYESLLRKSSNGRAGL